jgi:hypothetical protein
MAQKISVTITDDLTGEEDAREVEFGFDGTLYKIDLTAKNKQIFADQMARYVEKAERVGGSRGRGRGRAIGSSNGHPRRVRGGASRERSADIRAWAKDQGIAVSERGRIPVAIQEQYSSTH